MALIDLHGFEDSVRWRVTQQGVEIERTGVERTPGRPVTVTRVLEAYGQEINTTAKAHRVPVELIVATICTESGGQPDSVRQESGYTSDEATPNKVSVGLTQTLISTAQKVMRASLGREWLLAPANSITAGTAYIASQARQTGLDPPLVAAAYNAGQLRHQPGADNRWKLRQYPIGTGKHVDRFVRFFNDAVAVLASRPGRPSVSIDDLLGTSPPRPRPTERAATAELSVRWGEHARSEVVGEHALGVLRDVMRAASLSDLLVSSTQRAPMEQARVMFDNCERHGAEAQKKLYSRYGDQVIDVYVAGKAAGRAADRIIAEMRDKVVDLGPANVSRHTADPRVLAVIDIAPSSVRDKAAFERAVKADQRVSTFLVPPTDPAYHMEIPQPR